jgi:Lsr2
MIRMDSGTARYELDLCQSHFDEVTGAGRRLRPRRRTGRARVATKAANKAAAAETRRRGRGALDTAAVHEWARAHGHTVSDRGRIPPSHAGSLHRRRIDDLRPRIDRTQ